MVFVGRDGRLVSGDSDLSLIRTFATMRAANQFFDMMNGRYGGRPLFLVDNQEALTLSSALRNARDTNALFREGCLWPVDAMPHVLQNVICMR